jgi:trehalose synthase
VKNSLLETYGKIAGDDVIDHLRQLARYLKGIKVVHVNSNRTSGEVAEILTRLVPLKRELGIDANWEVINSDGEFLKCTKGIHNALHGNRVSLSENLIKSYEDTNARNAEEIRPILEDADIVFIHDPQPAMLIKYFPERKNKWVWRCHIDVSKPYRPIWRYLREFLAEYDASIFSLPAFTRKLPHQQYLVPPSIDPLSDRNIDLQQDELDPHYTRFGLDPDRPIILQVSRFDRFKDPLGVIEAFEDAKKFMPLQLILAGGEANDDPEGELVLKEVQEAAASDPDIHVYPLPPNAPLTINALQRISDVVLQKSIKEGFGLTVSEAMWKGKPVIGGNAGGISTQIVNYHTGFLVNTPEGAALRIRYLLSHREKLEEMGSKAREFVRENFLLTRHLREYLALMVSVSYGFEDRIELS